MYAQVEKSKENKSRAVANLTTQKKSNGKQGFGFVDNRSKTENMKSSQQMIDARSYEEPSSHTIQRAIDVVATNQSYGILVKATGDADEFEDGDNNGDIGWSDVNKYTAKYQVDWEEEEEGENVRKRKKINKQEIKSQTWDNEIALKADCGHVLGQQNGGKRSQARNVFAQNPGINNGTYKSFETKMRSALNNALDKDESATASFISKLEIEGDPKRTNIKKMYKEAYVSDVESDSDIGSEVSDTDIED